MVISIFPVFFAFYIGAWCDLFGRKPLLYMYWVAKMVSQVLVLVCAIFLKSEKEYYLIALAPTALVGKV